MRKLNAKEKLLIDIYNSLDNAFDYEEEKERRFKCILDYEKKLSKKDVAKNLIRLKIPKEIILEATGLKAKEYDKLSEEEFIF